MLTSPIISLVLHMRVSPTLPNTSLFNREIYPRNKTERSYLVLPKDDTKTHHFVETGSINRRPVKVLYIGPFFNVPMVEWFG